MQTAAMQALAHAQKSNRTGKLNRIINFARAYVTLAHAHMRARKHFACA